MPPPLGEIYDGGLSIREGGVYANFVSSIDGIVALEGGAAASGGVISGRNEADRFVMGLLRALGEGRRSVLAGRGGSVLAGEGGRMVGILCCLLGQVACRAVATAR